VAKPYAERVPLVFDTSAWNRQGEAHVSDRWMTTLEAGLLAACPVVTLEVLRGAPDEARREALDRALTDLAPHRNAPITREICDMALSASRELRGDRRGIPAGFERLLSRSQGRAYFISHRARSSITGRLNTRPRRQPPPSMLAMALPLLCSRAAPGIHGSGAQTTHLFRDEPLRSGFCTLWAFNSAARSITASRRCSSTWSSRRITTSGRIALP
jgi:predicted nucleic acid-binding protein